MSEENTAPPPSSSNGLAAAQANSPEVKEMTPGSNRKSFTIPKLDEKQLEMKLPDAGGATSSFVVADGASTTTTTTTNNNNNNNNNSTATETTSAPLNSNAPAFVFNMGSPYANVNMLGVDSPSSNAAHMAFLQQLGFQYQMQQPVSASEQELFLTHGILQQCPRAVLLMVLTSLVDECPMLCPMIRQRCEKAALLLHQQQQVNAASRYATRGAATAAAAGGGGGGTTQWGSHANASNFESPRTTSFAGSASPHGGSSRKGRGNKSREEGLCSVHNNVRSMNHLQLNKRTGLHECVHGFHCLEDGGSSAVTPSHNSASPLSVTNNHNSAKSAKNSNVGNFKVNSHPQMKASSGHSKPLRENGVANHRNSGNINDNKQSCAESSHSNSGGMTPREGSEQHDKGGAADLSSELDMLKNILQSVRELAEREA